MINIAEILKKDHLKIIITDSGLGGLSVQALLDKELRGKTEKQIELIFFNSLADHAYGYNNIKEVKDKLRVFNSALEGMLKYNPDMILIACNSLSVLYSQTEISSKITIPVIGIIENGIEMILENIIDKQYGIIILGTETTIKSDQHRIKLLEKGIDMNRIVTQPCKNLESEIQDNANSENVESLIDKYLTEALENIYDKSAHQLILFACTHFGYSENIFRKKLKEIIGSNFTILNPNVRMSKLVRFEESSSNNLNLVTNRILSRTTTSEIQINNLAELLNIDSPSVALALRNYEHIPELFYFNKSELSSLEK